MSMEFAETAAEEIYVNADHDWPFSHVTQRSLNRAGRARLKYFFQTTSRRLRSLQQISNSRGWIRLRYHFPSQFEWDAYVVCHAESQDGPAELHFILWKAEKQWQIDRMWWSYLQLP